MECTSHHAMGNTSGPPHLTRMVTSRAALGQAPAAQLQSSSMSTLPPEKLREPYHQQLLLSMDYA